MGNKKILLVQNDRAKPGAVFGAGCQCSTARDGAAAYEQIVSGHFDLVVTDLHVQPMGGLDFLRRVGALDEAPPVVLMSEHAGVREAVDAMKLGAHDFLLKPLTLEMVQALLSQVSGNGHKNRTRRDRNHTLITRNGNMTHLLQQARDIADSRASVFIQGESGTGKELFARYLHRHSRRKDSAFIAVNCSALPETLLESELFGHEKGAFTGAVARKKGKFEMAHRGTLLLDEISEMDVQLQSKLLRVLQEKEVDRVGGETPIPIDVRIIATTNRHIEEDIEKGRFREDLFYRLNVIPFFLPPLRERPDDICLLARHFIEKFNAMDSRCVKGLTAEAEKALLERPWKGNVRELENVMERAVLMCKTDRIQADDLFLQPRRTPVPASLQPAMLTGSLKDMEKRYIFQALDRTRGNRTHAAEILGISVRTLRNKLNEYKNAMEAANKA